MMMSALFECIKYYVNTLVERVSHMYFENPLKGNGDSLGVDIKKLLESGEEI